MPVLRHIGQLVTCAEPGGQATVHPIEDAAVAWRNGSIVWVGTEADIPSEFEDDTSFDAGGSLVVPGLIDAHTHLAFAGWRADEFALRVRGATYQEIARAGGGIRRSMEQLRSASDESLLIRCRSFLDQMERLGVTTVEAKSGYGLTEADELRVLRVYRELAATGSATIIPTLLAAHTIPPEYATNRSGYVDLVCERIIPRAAEESLARFCDVFVEDGAFTADEARRILDTATRYGIRGKLHIDQLSDGDGGRLAAELGATSADHLEYTSAAGMHAMAEAGVVAVALPIASLYLRQPPMNGRAFVDAGCRVAVATDFNPGSAPSFHLPWAMTLACTMNGLSPVEALKGATLYAAVAIGEENRRGSVEIGKQADMVVIDAESIDQWLYHFRPNAATAVFRDGLKLAG